MVSCRQGPLARQQTQLIFPIALSHLPAAAGSPFRRLRVFSCKGSFKIRKILQFVIFRMGILPPLFLILYSRIRDVVNPSHEKNLLNFSTAAGGQRQSKKGGEQKRTAACAAVLLSAFSRLDYSPTSVTAPEPTVRPPSRIAKRRPFSMAMGVISSTLISTLSPGMHISTPSGRVMTPVTSVVRK